MNDFEKCAKAVLNTPQPLWFEKRFKPLAGLILNWMKYGKIKQTEVHSPILDMLGTSMWVLKFEGTNYLFSFNQVGKVYNWYKLEKITPTSSSLNGTMISSSDDDPYQESYMDNLAMMLDAKTPAELCKKLDNL